MYTPRVPGSVGIRNRAVDGFLLIEVMVTLVIIAVALLALGRLQAGLISHSAQARHQVFALQLARNRLERLSYRAGHVMGDMSRSGQRTLGPSGSGSDMIRAGMERHFLVRWESLALGRWEDELSVRVSWQEAGLKRQSVRLVTRRCRLPPYVPKGPGQQLSLRQLWQH